MYTVIKRDGRSAEFHLTRISHAITKAFDATGIPYSPDVINLLSLQVTADFAPKVNDDTIDVESIPQPPVRTAVPLSPFWKNRDFAIRNGM